MDEKILENVKNYLRLGHSRRHIVKNLLKGQICDATIVKYLGDYEKSLREELKNKKYNEIKNSYIKNSGNISRVLKECDSSHQTVEKALKFFNVDKINILKSNQHARKSRINDSFFEKIDSEIKAYYLGYFYADGNVNIRMDKRKPNTHISKAEISQAESDKYILLPLSLEIYNEDKIKTYAYKNRSKETQNKCFLAINSKKICEDLIKLKCIPRKSLTLTFPTFDIVPQNLMNHFIRGYFDGDGHIGIYKYGGRVMSVHCENASSKFFNAGLKLFLENNYQIKSTLVIDKRKNNNFSILRILDGRKGIKKMYDFLYKDALFFLERKKKKFAEIIEYQPPIKFRQHYKNGKNIKFYGKSWSAHINFKGKRIYLGLFVSQQDAIHAYNSKIDEINSLIMRDV